MTFSIVARCADTGMFGMAVSSSSPAVGARCSHVRCGVGAVGTQNFTDPTLGWRGLDLLERGASAGQCIATLTRTAAEPAYRQLLAIGRSGEPAVHTGTACMALTAHVIGPDAAAAGNLLASADVPDAMLAAFTQSSGHLAGRLLCAMRAGMDAGGETEPVRSAGLVVTDAVAWPVADLRVDWTEGCPITELERLWAVWEPRMPVYLARALQPAQAPVTDC